MKAPRIVFVPGCWDLLHRGHLNLLFRARALGDVLVVGVVSDAGAMAYKGRMPAQNAQLRMQNIARLGFVDVVEIQRTTDPTLLLERFRPNVLVHADGDSEWTALREQVAALGVEYVCMPYTPEISTTSLRAKLEATA